MASINLKGAIILNKFYTDDGLNYINERFIDIFTKKGVTISCPKIYASNYNSYKEIQNLDFALFFDKDLALARFLEGLNIRVFNCCKTIEICDDKEKTYDAVKKFTNIKTPKTIVSPLIYNNPLIYDTINAKAIEFLNYVKSNISYPIIIKHNSGSQGKQVFMAKNDDDLFNLFNENKFIPHMYQEFIGHSEASDIRVFIIANKAVFCVNRTNTTDFRAGLAMGGKMEIYEPPQTMINYAETIAKEINLEYGSVDFLLDATTGEPIFLEANSNAYLKTAEKLGANLAEKYADYIISQF